MTTVDKANNFVIVVERRMTQVYKTLSLIGNLSNKRYYEYSDEEVNELFLKLLDKGNEIKKFFLEIKEKAKSYDYVLTTEKDIVKIDENIENLLILKMEFKIIEK